MSENNPEMSNFVEHPQREHRTDFRSAILKASKTLSNERIPAVKVIATLQALRESLPRPHSIPTTQQAWMLELQSDTELMNSLNLLKEPLFRYLSNASQVRVVRQACLTLQDISETLKHLSCHVADLVMPSLIQLTAAGNRSIVEHADATARIILKNTQIKGVRYVLYSATHSRKVTTRVKCSEYILLILQHWSMEHLEKHLLAIEECIPYLVKDTAGSVQRIGIQLFWTFGPYWSSQRDGFLSSLDPPTLTCVMDACPQNPNDSSLSTSYSTPDRLSRKQSHLSNLSSPLASTPRSNSMRVVSRTPLSSKSNRSKSHTPDISGTQNQKIRQKGMHTRAESSPNVYNAKIKSGLSHLLENRRNSTIEAISPHHSLKKQQKQRNGRHSLQPADLFDSEISSNTTDSDSLQHNVDFSQDAASKSDSPKQNTLDITTMSEETNLVNPSIVQENGSNQMIPTDYQEQTFIQLSRRSMCATHSPQLIQSQNDRLSSGSQRSLPEHIVSIQGNFCAEFINPRQWYPSLPSSCFTVTITAFHMYDPSDASISALTPIGANSLSALSLLANEHLNDNSQMWGESMAAKPILKDSPFIRYHIEIRCGWIQHIVCRRYNEFNTLFREISTCFTQLNSLVKNDFKFFIPSLPPKTWCSLSNSRNVEFLKRRAIGLDVFLRELLAGDPSTWKHMAFSDVCAKKGTCEVESTDLNVISSQWLRLQSFPQDNHNDIQALLSRSIQAVQHFLDLDSVGLRLKSFQNDL